MSSLPNNPANLSASPAVFPSPTLTSQQAPSGAEALPISPRPVPSTNPLVEISVASARNERQAGIGYCGRPTQNNAPPAERPSNGIERHKPLPPRPVIAKRKKSVAINGGRGNGFTQRKMDTLLDLLEENLPIWREEWEKVELLHAERFPEMERNADSLKRKFACLHRMTWTVAVESARQRSHC